MSNILNDIAQIFGKGALGLVPNGKRSVTPVPADLLALVPKPTGRNEVVKKRNADPLKDTVPMIQKLIKRQAWQGKKLAAALKGSTVEETVRNNWDFFMNHIQYVQDPDTRETVRSLRRTVHEGKGDCDCFVNGLGNLLYNQGIKNAKLRVAAYNNADQVSHIYIKVPGSYSGMLTLDPVIHKFNYEEPFTYKKDFPMTLESLDGFGACAPSGSGSDGSGNNSNTNQIINKLNVFVNTQTVVDQGLIPTQQFLEKNKIPYTQQHSNELNASEFLVETPGGEIKVPSIMKPEQAEQLKQLMASVGQQAQAVAEDLKSKFKWWWVVAAALGLFLIFGGREKKPSKNVNITLNGPGRLPKRRAKKEKAKSRKHASPGGRVLPALSI
jgi:hypothetical protein